MYGVLDVLTRRFSEVDVPDLHLAPPLAPRAWQARIKRLSHVYVKAPLAPCSNFALLITVNVLKPQDLDKMVSDAASPRRGGVQELENRGCLEIP